MARSKRGRARPTTSKRPPGLRDITGAVAGTAPRPRRGNSAQAPGQRKKALGLKSARTLAPGHTKRAPGPTPTPTPAPRPRMHFEIHTETRTPAAPASTRSTNTSKRLRPATGRPSSTGNGAGTVPGPGGMKSRAIPSSRTGGTGGLPRVQGRKGGFGIANAPGQRKKVLGMKSARSLAPGKGGY
jgi:hypothetical protein